MQVTQLSNGQLVQRCQVCGFVEALPYSNRRVHYVNNLVMQHKKAAADDTLKETLQPVFPDGSLNEEFTEAYGYNPFDPKSSKRSPIKAAR